MPMYALNCMDKPDSFALRAATRPSHLAYVGERGVKLGGPYCDDQGRAIGSLIIIEAADKAAAETWSANDPYRKAGLFQSVEITEWRYTAGQLP